ncbi:response regulator transcription factor [Phytomonospora endophytica]|uniref:response regulator transcription factor n=1 Tax=Phytomonospora endophytica TaxID=714109 RepID=UPI00161A2ACD|nr:response regulator transcription factor [Phytomonospora endophytica]
MRVLLAEDAALTRGGLTEILRVAGHSVDAVHDGDELMARIAAGVSDVDLVITDVRMPPTSTDEGLRAAMALRGLRPPVPVLVLSSYVEPEYAAELLADPGGGVGYLLKDKVARVEDFLTAVRLVAGGGTAVDTELMNRMLRRNAGDDRLRRLTPRETEVLGLLAEGRNNAAIARALVIGLPAVEKHIGNVFLKLDLPADLDGNRRVLAVLAYLRRRT